MKTFAEIYDRAASRKGGEDQLKDLLPTGIKSTEDLAGIPDDRYLSQMTESIFKAGFVWKVVENKWPGFEEAFWQFHVVRCAAMSSADEAALAQDTRIIRNPQKIRAVAKNATMVLDVAHEHGSFGKFIAEWPDDDFIGLLAFLHKNGSRLGGRTCQLFLRFIGKDGFVLWEDGIAALIDAGVVTKNPTSKTDLRAVQAAFNQWREESGYGNAELSRILSLSIDS